MKGKIQISLIGAAAMALLAVLALFGCNGNVSAENGSVSELQIVDQKIGEGREATPGSRVQVHYTGWLMSGTKFDSSRDRRRPFAFRIGAGEVIRGWDQGVVGMREGGIRELTIPPFLGYGSQGAGNVIPPGATLRFEIELLKVE